jgi:Skp family chaperone for outer membrane proteins
MDLIAVLKTAFDSGAAVALAIFAIWMLRQAYQDQAKKDGATLERERQERAEDIERERQDRQRLVEVIDRNTQAWSETTKALAALTSGVTSLVGAVNAGRQETQDIRLLLARRPCVADHALKQIDQG